MVIQLLELYSGRVPCSIPREDAFIASVDLNWTSNKAQEYETPSPIDLL